MKEAQYNTAVQASLHCKFNIATCVHRHQHCCNVSHRDAPWPRDRIQSWFAVLNCRTHQRLLSRRCWSSEHSSLVNCHREFSLSAAAAGPMLSW